jgi:hypothetical protein
VKYAVDIHTKFHEDRLRHSEVVRGDNHTRAQTQQDDPVILLYFFQSKESRLNILFQTFLTSCTCHEMQGTLSL